ncbi:DUF3189 family protein [Bacillus sp. SB49]|uniref:DUF3189 family protein n=1 Tax=Bacillaceae TaxID=186817 RepID=UPI0002A4E1BE|nr:MULTISPECIES: DUF3189 family protein [Bacillaceae]ELK45605.1 hypothetical protein D479_14157 [Halobacillus sp. BAB-2008]QHT46081.1 DUF3189 family protein [Bacillus sp. SB49]
MIYIYNDYGGTHTTSIAAAYHLGYLQKGQILDKQDILEIPFFNKLTKKDAGRLLFHGQDSKGHDVYTIGRKSQNLVVPALSDLCQIFFQMFDIEDRIVFSNTSPTVPFVMSIGGGLSRGLGIDTFGVPLLIKGAQKCHPLIEQLVEHTIKTAEKDSDEPIIVLENDDFYI